MRLLALLAPFTAQNDRCQIRQLLKSLLFHAWRYLFSVGPHRISHYRDRVRLAWGFHTGCAVRLIPEGLLTSKADL